MAAVAALAPFARGAWDSLPFATALVPAFVFALAGAAKLHDPLLAAVFVENALAVPFSIALAVARAAAVLEIGIAVSLCLFLGRARWPGIAGLCLLAFFLGMLVQLGVRYGAIATCGCFGSLMGYALRRSPSLQIMIDLGLVGFLVCHLVLTWRAAGHDPVRRAPVACSPGAPA